MRGEIFPWRIALADKRNERGLWMGLRVGRYMPFLHDSLGWGRCPTLKSPAGTHRRDPTEKRLEPHRTV